MSSFTSPAILLRRISYGEYDIIITFLTLKRGKLAVIAKNAKKSQKRFMGILEPFSQLNLVCKFVKGRSLGVLQEASIENPFSGIRSDMVKTAYASYWSELINIWCEEGKAQKSLYGLLKYCLQMLDTGEIAGEVVSIIFQMRFLNFSGLTPFLTNCSTCKIETDKIGEDRVIFELAKGGVVCQGCSSIKSSRHILSKGIIKQLLWIQENELTNLKRLKFSKSTLEEGLNFLETFVPYHLGKEPKSLQFLKKIRQKGIHLQ